MALTAGFYTGLAMIDQKVQSARTLLETYQADIFNARSRGTISFGTRRQTSTVGETFAWDRLTRKGEFRDPRVRTPRTEGFLNQFSTKTIKMGSVWGPDVLDISSADWKGIPFARLGTVRGQQIASDSISRRAQIAVSGLNGAFGVSGLAGLTTDKRAPAGTALASVADANKMTLANLLDAQAVLGDNYESIRVWVMHSKPFHDLLKANVSNASRLFTIANVGITSFLGKTFIVTDNPRLIVAQSGSGGSLRVQSYYTLGLKAGACSVDAAGEFRSVTNEITGKENLEVVTQAQDSMILGISNMQYTQTVEPKSYADLATAANWATDIGVVDLKDYFGVRLQTN